MVSAVCVGAGAPSPVTSYTNGAKCGYGDSNAEARILCMPGQQSMRAPAGGEAAIHLVASDSNVAACESGETMFSAYCTGGWDDYPLLTYPGGRVKCGYSSGMSKANVACLQGAGEASGLRVVASDSNTASCESGETMVSAYCTGSWGAYPLQTYGNRAKCGYSGGGAKATVVCAAGAAESGPLRVVSGSNVEFCGGDEVMVSAMCSGSGRDYPLQTYPNGAKCGYSGDASKVTLTCMKL
jgi:hypothetical protein